VFAALIRRFPSLRLGELPARARVVLADPARRFVLLAALGAALVNWIATSPAALVHVNWDASVYLHGIAERSLLWKTAVLWNAHYALTYVYVPIVALARLLGGTTMDGFRLVNSIFLALGAAMLADLFLRLLRARLVAALFVAAWLTAFVTAFLIFTVEDNIVFLTPAIAVMRLCVLRAETWRMRDAVAAGLLVAAAELLSVQGVLYIAPAIYVTVVLRPRGVGLLVRLRDLVLLFAGLFAGWVLCLLLLAATTTHTLRELASQLFVRPDTAGFNAMVNLKAVLLDVQGSLRSLGLAVSYQLLRFRAPFADPALVRMGGTLLAFELLLWVGATVLSWRRRTFAPHLLASTLLLFTLLTAIYRDVDFAFLKRTDFLPILLFLTAAASLGPALGNLRVRIAAAGLVGGLVAWQLATDLIWRAREVAAYPTLNASHKTVIAPTYHGVPNVGSYFRFYRQIHRANPGACLYVFDFSEIMWGRWNPDVTGQLWSELPNHLVVGDPAVMARWRQRVRVKRVREIKASLRGCEWISPAARRALDL
jgi:hypothetical protein